MARAHHNAGGEPYIFVSCFAALRLCGGATMPPSYSYLSPQNFPLSTTPPSTSPCHSHQTMTPLWGSEDERPFQVKGTIMRKQNRCESHWALCVRRCIKGKSLANPTVERISGAWWLCRIEKPTTLRAVRYCTEPWVGGEAVSVGFPSWLL